MNQNIKQIVCDKINNYHLRLVWLMQSKNHINSKACKAANRKDYQIDFNPVSSLLFAGANPISVFEDKVNGEGIQSIMRKIVSKKI